MAEDTTGLLIEAYVNPAIYSDGLACVEVDEENGDERDMNGDEADYSHDNREPADAYICGGQGL